ASTISLATSGEVRRRPKARTLASFQRRAPRAVSASVHNAARTPATLLAAIDTPVPVQQHTTPRSATPDATASPTARPTSGHGSPSPTTTTSTPRPARSALTASVSGVRSSVPNATRTDSAHDSLTQRVEIALLDDGGAGCRRLVDDARRHVVGVEHHPEARSAHPPRHLQPVDAGPQSEVDDQRVGLVFGTGGQPVV